MEGRRQIITNQDYLEALYGYKRIHCPKLTGLNKQQLGQLARRMGLDVVPTGKKRRPDGLGTGKHRYKPRTATTWRGTPQERELERNRAFDDFFGRRQRGDMRAEQLDKQKRRDAELERVRGEIERAQMGAEDKDAPAKKKPKKKKKLKVVQKAEDVEKKREEARKRVQQIVDDATEEYQNSPEKNFMKKNAFITRVFESIYKDARPERYNRIGEQSDYDLRAGQGRVDMIMDITD